VWQGFLKDRIDKGFTYFEDEKREDECARYARIVHKRVFAKQIAWFIESEISNIAAEVRQPFSVLVICATSTQCRLLAEALAKKGLQNIDYAERGPAEPTLLDGLRILRLHAKSNLGWRVVAGVLLQKDALQDVLRKTEKEGSRPLVELVGSAVKSRVQNMLKCLKDIEEGVPPDKACLEEILLESDGKSPNDIASAMVKARLDAGGKNYGTPGVKNIPIKITTVQSSKGLAKDFVFIAHFDDRYFIGDKTGKISDRDICSFLVAMTRARKKLYLISTQEGKTPTFLTWIESARIEKV
jgi:UvrD-like helicase family protein